MKNLFKKISKISVYTLYKNYKDTKAYKKCIEQQQQQIRKYSDENIIRKLHIGCGSNYFKGWLNTDLNYNEKVAFLDAGKTFPLISDSFDAVYSEHLFEHLNLNQQINMLKESYRVLKKGGTLRIATPSIKFLFELYQNPNSDINKNYQQWAIQHSLTLKSVKENISDDKVHHIYVINNFFRAWGHQLIHDFESLSALTIQCGFNTPKSFNIGESEVEYLKSVEKHMTIIPSKMNLLETMIIEVTK